jgi:hypothetical protein
LSEKGQQEAREGARRRRQWAVHSHLLAAAVDDELPTGHEASLVRGQEQRRVRDLLRRRYPLDQYVLRHGCEHRCGRHCVIFDGAAAGDADLAARVETINGERLVGTRMVALRLRELGALRPGLSLDRARVAIWTLNSVVVWHPLTDLRRWSPRAYEQWVTRAMCDAVLERCT